MGKRQGSGPRHLDPEEDRETGPVRNYPANSVFDPRLAVGVGTREWGLPVPQPLPRAAAPLDAAILADRPCLGQACRTRWLCIRHALDATDESGADLQEDGEPACGAAA